MMSRISALLSVAIAALLLAPAPAAAYAFISEAGCVANQGAAWQGISPWYLNSSGYSTVERSTLETVLRQSIDVWGEPCCSGFAHDYRGTTTGSSITNDSRNIVEFFEASWPREFGSANSTIAVTLPSITFGCTYVGADMAFNGVGFRFRTDGRITDLQSIATHEFGHWLGLDHTTAPGGTMLPYYSNGTSERTLTQDDIDGVCALYPATCTGCSGDAECNIGQLCQAGACVTQTCSSTAGCPMGTLCLRGSCLPGCRSDSECGGNDVCQGGSCKRPPADCSICEPCSSSAECGGAGYHCVETGTGGICTKQCGSNADCDGNSVCARVQAGNEVYDLCFAPDPDELCPADYVCSEAPVDPCAGISCDEGFACVDGGCIDRCEGITCPADEICTGGSCVSPCGSCASGMRCDIATRSCVDIDVDPCASVQCAEDEQCVAGACISDARCEPACAADEVCRRGVCTRTEVTMCDSCSAAERCHEGRCIPAASCEGGSCAAGSICVAGLCISDGSNDGSGRSRGGGGCAAAGGTGLSGLALVGLALRRRR